MSRISVGRSALTTAVAGSAIVGVVLLLGLGAISTGGETSSVSLRIGKPPFEWQVPAANRILSGGPLTLAAVFLVFLLLSFAVFLMIGRRAARPIEEARRRQFEFAIDASHELRTPLTVVEGEASLALRGIRGADQYRLALEKILGEGRRMRQMVDDLMWLARAEADPPTPRLYRSTWRTSRPRPPIVSKPWLPPSISESRLPATAIPDRCSCRQLNGWNGWPVCCSTTPAGTRPRGAKYAYRRQKRTTPSSLPWRTAGQESQSRNGTGSLTASTARSPYPAALDSDSRLGRGWSQRLVACGRWANQILGERSYRSDGDATARSEAQAPDFREPSRSEL